MELKILTENEQPLLNRKEITGEIKFDQATPSTEDVKTAIVKKTGSSEKTTIVKNIYTEFGDKTAKFCAYVYNDKTIMDKVENKNKNKKKKKAAGKK